MKYLVALVLLVTASAANAFDFKTIEDHHPSVPDPMRYTVARPTTLAAIPNWYAMGIVGCGALTLMLDVAIKHRELKRSEATAVVASCFLPVLGGMITNYAFLKHPEWEIYSAEERAAVHRDRLGINSQSGT